MPRPRFTMRVALAVTAIVAVLAWQGGIVWQRKAAMVNSEHKFIHETSITGAPAGDRQRVNFLRSLMGDEPVRQIYMVPGEDWKTEQVRLQGLFPEATIDVLHPHIVF